MKHVRGDLCCIYVCIWHHTHMFTVAFLWEMQCDSHGIAFEVNCWALFCNVYKLQEAFVLCQMQFLGNNLLRWYGKSQGLQARNATRTLFTLKVLFKSTLKKYPMRIAEPFNPRMYRQCQISSITVQRVRGRHKKTWVSRNTTVPGVKREKMGRGSGG